MQAFYYLPNSNSLHFGGWMPAVLALVASVATWSRKKDTILEKMILKLTPKDRAGTGIPATVII